LSLEKVAQSLVEQLPGTDTDIDTSLRERQRKVELWAKILGTGVISIAMLAFIGGISTTPSLSKGMSYIPSVTERTTDLLAVERKERRE
jgi:hypothetical protein